MDYKKILQFVQICNPNALNISIMRNEHLVCYTIGLQILIFLLGWIANPAEQNEVNVMPETMKSTAYELHAKILA